MIVCRITTAEAWAAATATGELPLDPDGFVHLSTPSQVPGTIDRYYADVPDLLVLDVDADLLPDGALKWEQSFPHLYGPLPVASVVGIRSPSE